MAAPCRIRCRSKTMPGALLPLLFVLLGLTLATLATGNDAISAPKSQKDLQQQPNRQQDIEDDGGTRPDKDFDFAAYVNDFNLQEEATIPEDIFDQHDGDIEDEDAGSPQMQYAPSGAAAAAAPSAGNDEEAGGDDDDDDGDEDAGLGLQEQPEEEDDASEAADIILESQRPTSRNFSVYLDAKKYQNGNNNNNGGKKRAKEKKNNISHYNYKLKNNKENQPATKATAGDNGDGGGADPAGGGGGTTFTSGDEDNANFGRQSFAYKKFKNMHEQQNQQHQQEPQPQPHLAKEQRKRGDDGQQLLEESQLFDSIEILNERKFNKPSQAPSKEQRQVDQEAIGDIEDNLDNDEALPTDDDDDEDEDPSEDGGESLDIKLPSDNDGLGKLTATTSTARTTTLATSKATTTTTRATPTTTTTTTLTPTPTPTTTSSTTRSPTPQPQIIGHKQKRHGGGNVFGLKRPQYYGNNYEIGRIRQQEQEPEPELDNSEEVEDLNLGEMHYYDNGNVNRKLATFDMARSENLDGNSLGSPAKKLQQPRFVDDDYAEQQPPAEEEEKPEVEQVEKSDLDSEWQRYRQETTEPPTAPTSAFERFKALRRSRQRTGHKSHKKRYKDYLKRQPAGTPPPPPSPSEPSLAARHLQKLQKERERERERSSFSHSPPIFAVGLRPQKPFYEGQVNYFDHHQLEQEQEQQQQLEEELKHRTEMERLIAHDNGNWYRRISPVLRNGVKSGEPPKHHHHQHHHSGHLGNHHHGNHHQGHHYKQQEQQQHHQHHHHHSHHQKVGLRSRPSNPYQRKPNQNQNQGQGQGQGQGPSSPPPTPPLPPPKPQLGHQITELQHLERYYAKWPHLARVQFQVYDEHYREAHPELYGEEGEDYEDDYESAAELEEAQQERGEEANLPPYIKKYNRRNKQLLNLLEGTLPTPTNAPGSPASTESFVRLDDEYLKEKRRRYHQHQQQQQKQQQHIDLFAQQKIQQNATEAPFAGAKAKPETTTAGYIYVANGNVIQKLKLNDGVFKDEEYKDEIEEERRAAAATTVSSNQLPEEDVAALDSLEEHQDPAPAGTSTGTGTALDFWQREMARGKANVASTSTSTPKPALFKLPSYPAIAGSFLGTPRSRSRSAQFVANVAGRGQSSWPRLDTVNATAEKPSLGGENPPGGAGGGGGGAGRGAPSPLNSFVYHRVVDGIGISNGIGGGTGSGLARGKQSRLPFVAITDRRLDRSLGERHKDFEQNHYPMP